MTDKRMELPYPERLHMGSAAFTSLPSPPLFADVCADLLRSGLPIRFRASGWSMWPTICEGELIEVEPVEPARVGRGDIVLCRQGNSVIVHRVVAVKGCGALPRLLTTRGDALDSCDEPLAESRVCGRVICVERGRRRVPLVRRRRRMADMRFLANKIRSFSAADSDREPYLSEPRA